jgi:Fe-S-cluster containining protein
MLSLSKANYTCTGCGDCCKGWSIPLLEKGEADTYRKYAGQLISADRLKKAMGRSRVGDGEFETLALAGKACPVLKDDNRCGIHGQFGSDSKPHVCRMFPFKFVATPTSVRVGLSYACPAVVDAEGPTLEEQRGEIEALYKSAIEGTQYLVRVSDEVELSEGIRLPWSEAERLIAELAAAFSSETTLLRRAGKACALMALVDTKMSDGMRFAEAFAAARAGAGALLDEALAGQPAGDRLSRALFRTLVKVSNSKRLGGNIWSSLFGGGKVQLRTGGEVSWSDAESVAPGLGAEGEALFSRWAVDALDSCTFFGRPAFGLSLASGLDLLVISAGVGAFLARAEASHQGRKAIIYEDAKRGLRQLDAGITHRAEMPPRFERALRATDSIDLLRAQLG